MKYNLFRAYHLSTEKRKHIVDHQLHKCNFVEFWSSQKLYRPSMLVKRRMQEKKIKLRRQHGALW